MSMWDTLWDVPLLGKRRDKGLDSSAASTGRGRARAGRPREAGNGEQEGEDS